MMLMPRDAVWRYSVPFRIVLLYDQLTDADRVYQTCESILGPEAAASSCSLPLGILRTEEASLDFAVPVVLVKPMSGLCGYAAGLIIDIAGPFCTSIDRAYPWIRQSAVWHESTDRLIRLSREVALELAEIASPTSIVMIMDTYLVTRVSEVERNTLVTHDFLSCYFESMRAHGNGLCEGPLAL